MHLRALDEVKVRWPRELNALQLQKTHAIKKKHQQIKKTSSSV